MPYIHIQTNAPIKKEQESEITKDLGAAISLAGKSESWLMLRYEGSCDMAFRGDADHPVAFVGISLYGKPGGSLDMFSAEITRILNRRLDIDSDRIYIRYLYTQDWGWNGSNF